MYFYRLAILKPAVSEIAKQAWEGFMVNGEEVKMVDSVLGVRQGMLCWIVGTIFMDMPLKPNILDDINKDVSLIIVYYQRKW
jgi:DNA polymerase delta subunit 2